MLTDRKGALLTSDWMTSLRRRTAASPRSLAPPRRALLLPYPPALRSPKRSLLEISAARRCRKRGFNLRAGQRLQGSDQKGGVRCHLKTWKKRSRAKRAPGARPTTAQHPAQMRGSRLQPSRQARLQSQIFPARGHGKDVSRALACRTPA